METKRLNYIDQLKGLAILLVVMGHVIKDDFGIQDKSILFAIICSFHMPLFAFLSGLMFCPKFVAKEATDKFVRQALKMLLPFIFVGLIFAYGFGYVGG